VTQGLGFHAPRDLVMRFAAGAPDLVPDVRRAIWEVDAEQPISDVRTMEALVATETAGRRNQLRLLGIFAALAFLMAGLGIHGVLSYLVSRRTREIGVRMALGAEARDIMRLVLAKGLALSLAGLALGAAGGLALGQGMRHLLFGVNPLDFRVLLATAALCLAASVTACLVPAWRACRVDPLTAVRAE